MMQNISETLIVGVDMIPGDIPTIMVAMRDFPQITFIRKIVGSDAMVTYNMLINKKVKVNIKELGIAHCPNCDADIHGMGRINFCPECGMGLDWSFTEPMITIYDKKFDKNLKGGK